MNQTRTRSRLFTRESAVERMRARLTREGFPRVQMFILVALTGLAGFGASAAMLGAGLDSMAMRYTLAMAVAYAVFFMLLWLWLRTSAADYIDMVPIGSSNPTEDAADIVGHGGTFDGSGASANFDTGSSRSAFEAVAENPLEAVASADEGAIPLAVILLALGIMLSSLFVVWSAPVLFAEIAVDALLAAGLYRRLRLLEPQHWMRAALRRTILPFVLTTLAVSAAGLGMQAYAPDARSLGDVLARR